jgi:hypothetical protein
MRRIDPKLLSLFEPGKLLTDASALGGDPVALAYAANHNRAVRSGMDRIDPDLAWAVGDIDRWEGLNSVAKQRAASLYERIADADAKGRWGPEEISAFQELTGGAKRFHPMFQAGAVSTGGAPAQRYLPDLEPLSAAAPVGGTTGRTQIADPWLSEPAGGTPKGQLPLTQPNTAAVDDTVNAAAQLNTPAATAAAVPTPAVVAPANVQVTAAGPRLSRRPAPAGDPTPAPVADTRLTTAEPPSPFAAVQGELGDLRKAGQGLLSVAAGLAVPAAVVAPAFVNATAAEDQSGAAGATVAGLSTALGALAGLGYGRKVGRVAEGAIRGTLPAEAASTRAIGTMGGNTLGGVGGALVGAAGGGLVAGGVNTLAQRFVDKASSGGSGFSAQVGQMLDAAGYSSTNDAEAAKIRQMQNSPAYQMVQRAQREQEERQRNQLIEQMYLQSLVRA